MYKRQQLLRGEPFRAKFRNSWEKPEALTPGKETNIDFTMPDLYHTFRRGHRIIDVYKRQKMSGSLKSSSTRR